MKTLRWSFYALVIFLGLGEFLLRWTNAIPLRVQANRIVLPRNRSYRFANKGLKGCDPLIVRHTNSLGFRGQEPPKEFEHHLTLVAVGGSSTECVYISDGHSWPELVETYLSSDFPKLWMNNAGIDGHSTFGHLILLQSYLVNLHPKIILYLVGDNDMDREDLNKTEKSFLLNERSWTQRIDYWVIEHSRLIATVQDITLALRAHHRGIGHGSVDILTLPLAPEGLPPPTPLSMMERDSLAGYQRRLKVLIAETRAAHIEPILITQPALFGPGKDPRTGVDLERMMLTRNLSGAAAWDKLQLYNDVTRQVAKEQEIPLIDLALRLPKDSDFFYDAMHFTNAGSLATSEIIAADLHSYLTKRFPEFSKK